MHMFTSIRISISTYYNYLHIYIHAYIYRYIHICMSTLIHIRYIHIYIYTHLQISTYLHTYIYIHLNIIIYYIAVEEEKKTSFGSPHLDPNGAAMTPCSCTSRCRRVRHQRCHCCSLRLRSRAFRGRGLP